MRVLSHSNQLTNCWGSDITLGPSVDIGACWHWCWWLSDFWSRLFLRRFFDQTNQFRRIESWTAKCEGSTESPHCLKVHRPPDYFFMVLSLYLCFITNVKVTNTMKNKTGKSGKVASPPLLAEVQRATVRSENRCGPNTHYTLPPMLATIISPLLLLH